MLREGGSDGVQHMPQQSLPLTVQSTMGTNNSPPRQHQPATVGRKLCFIVVVFKYIQCTWRGQLASEKASNVHGVWVYSVRET